MVAVPKGFEVVDSNCPTTKKNWKRISMALVLPVFAWSLAPFSSLFARFSNLSPVPLKTIALIPPCWVDDLRWVIVTDKVKAFIALKPEASGVLEDVPEC